MLLCTHPTFIHWVPGKIFLLKVHTFMQGFFQGVLGARLGSLKWEKLVS